MYRDDPLDDETELRDVIGDDAVDRLRRAEADLDVPGIVEAAFDAHTLLRGWVGEQEAAAWFTTSQSRLDGRTPVDAMVDGDLDEALDAARRFAAAQG